MYDGILGRKTGKDRKGFPIALSLVWICQHKQSLLLKSNRGHEGCLRLSLARETSRLRAVTVIEFLIENNSDLRLALQLLHSPVLPKSTSRQEELRRQTQTLRLVSTVYTLVHLILQAWLLFTKWAQVGDVHWDTCECLTADALEFGCKDAAGITGADHLTVKKETDSSWKANEHVSAIWGSWPKRYPSSAPRQRHAAQAHQSPFYTFFPPQ